MTAIQNEDQLDEALSRPSKALVRMMRRTKGDILVLGIAGKMGVTLGRQAVRAIEAAGVRKKVIGVARFSEPDFRRQLNACGVQTLRSDLLDPRAVAKLPDAPNIIYMVGRKFGTQGQESMTWAINALVPAYVSARFPRSRIVAFSTGCVYPLVRTPGRAVREDHARDPIGEYSQACLSRERIFEHFSKTNGTPMLFFRLGYAIDLRYGVLPDIARWVWAGQPVNLNVSHFNCIWQRDANERALLCLDHCASPPMPLNVTGAENVSVRAVAQRFGKLLDRPVRFKNKPSGIGYLVDAARSIELFGPPSVSLDEMIELTAAWVREGGRSLEKPTHFEVSNGKY